MVKILKTALFLLVQNVNWFGVLSKQPFKTSENSSESQDDCYLPVVATTVYF